MYNIGSNFTSIKITADDQEFNVLVEETYNPNGEPEPSHVVPREIGKYSTFLLIKGVRFEGMIWSK